MLPSRSKRPRFRTRLERILLHPGLPAHLSHTGALPRWSCRGRRAREREEKSNTPSPSPSVPAPVPHELKFQILCSASMPLIKYIQYSTLFSSLRRVCLHTRAEQSRPCSIAGLVLTTPSPSCTTYPIKKQSSPSRLITPPTLQKQKSNSHESYHDRGTRALMKMCNDWK